MCRDDEHPVDLHGGHLGEPRFGVGAIRAAGLRTALVVARRAGRRQPRRATSPQSRCIRRRVVAAARERTDRTACTAACSTIAPATSNVAQTMVTSFVTSRPSWAAAIPTIWLVWNWIRSLSSSSNESARGGAALAVDRHEAANAGVNTDPSYTGRAVEVRSIPAQSAANSGTQSRRERLSAPKSAKRPGEIARWRDLRGRWATNGGCARSTPSGTVSRTARPS